VTPKSTSGLSLFLHWLSVIDKDLKGICYIYDSVSFTYFNIFVHFNCVIQFGSFSETFIFDRSVVKLVLNPILASHTQVLQFQNCVCRDDI
jgi:hypothetical protein